MTGSGCCVPRQPTHPAYVERRNRHAGRESGDSHDLKGSLHLLRARLPRLWQRIRHEHGISVEVGFSTEPWLSGNVGYGNGSPNAVLRVLQPRRGEWIKPQIALTMRRLAAPESIRAPARYALALSASDEFSFGDILSFASGANCRPSVHGPGDGVPPVRIENLHLSPNTVLEYRYATRSRTAGWKRL
jgi:hypothetical protein